MKSSTISIDRITVPDFVERPLAKVPDDRDLRSIKANGIQQPLVLVPDGDRLLLAKGLRRLRIAKALGMGKVPYIEAPAPKGMGPEAYARELRLALDMHRQDLLPSQKAWIVEELKRRFGMTNKQIAVHLNVDADSITNWTSVRTYIPEVVAALDSDQMTMAAARVFAGMTEKGQGIVWRRHANELLGSGKAGVHKRIRTLYPPADHPTYYRQPGLVTQRLARKGGKRRPKTGMITSAEKRRLLSSVELKEVEIEEGVEEEKRLKAQITAAIAPIAAIMRSEKLREMLPPETLEEFARFQEVY